MSTIESFQVAGVISGVVSGIVPGVGLVVGVGFVATVIKTVVALFDSSGRSVTGVRAKY